MYRSAGPEQALIRSGFGGDVASFEGLWVLPIVHRIQVMDISSKRIVIERKGKQSLSCKDHVRADITLAIRIRVRPTPEDVLKIHRSLGAERVSDELTLHMLFEARVVQVMKEIARSIFFSTLVERRRTFPEQVMQAIRDDFDGFLIETVSIEYLEQTPLEFLDPNNILDAEGIKKITGERMAQELRENEVRRQKELDDARKKRWGKPDSSDVQYEG